MAFCSAAYLKNIIGTFSAEVVLARQDDHRLCKHLQTYRTYQLLLQVVHAHVFNKRFKGPKNTKVKEK